jgi:tetratricopeptide (TPR) repeat protein
VRSLVVVGLASVVAVSAAAQPQPTPFWSGVAQPNARRVEGLVGEGRVLVERAWAMRGGENAVRRRELFEEAAARFYRAVTLSPRHALARAQHALALAESGEVVRADVAFAEWHALTDGSDSDAVLRWGRALVRARRPDDAVTVIERALVDAAPGNRGPLLLASGYAQLSAGRLEDAAETFQRAAKSVVSVGDAQLLAAAQLGRAVAYDRDEQLGKAAEAIAAARAADPTLTSPLALAAAGGLLPFTPPSDLHYFRALAYEAVQRDEEALVEWRAYLAAPEPTYRSRAAEHVRALSAKGAR